MNPISTLRKLTGYRPSLQRLLILVVISQILSAVGLVGYLSFKNGQRAVAQLSERLIVATGYQVQQELEDFLSTPLQINHLNVDAIRAGLFTLEDPQLLESRLWNQLQAFDSVSYVYISSIEGGMVAAGRDDDGSYLIEETNNYPQSGDYLVFSADSQGNRLSQLQRIGNQSVTDKRWFKKPIAAKGPVWIEPFRYTAREQIVAIAASSPLYDASGDLQGVTTVDIRLDRLSNFLNGLIDSSNEQIFIVDRSGQLLAASDKDPIVLSRGRANVIKAKESPNPLVRESVKNIESRFGALSKLRGHRTEIQIEGESYFAQVTPWENDIGLDWLVVVLVPEAKFMGQIHANNKVTILLCLLSAIIASGVATWAARRISAPILRLSQASQALSEASRNGFAEGDELPKLKTSGIKELKTLALSFEQMSQQLRASHFQLNSYSQSLEAKVKERTQDLEKEIVVRKQAERQSLKAKETAEAASKVKSEFLANMSHELRSPLNAILGFAQLLKRDDTLSKENNESVSIINRSGEHLLGLINDILDMSKIEAGRAVYQPTEIDLHRLIDDLHGMFHLQAVEKQLAFNIQYSPSLPPYIYSDASKLRQILINLLGNAFKFTDEGSITLTINAQPTSTEPINTEPASLESASLESASTQSASLEPANPDLIHSEPEGPNPDGITLQFAVVDTGCGIDRTEFDRVLEPFVQTSSGEKSLAGTGLGLPISRSFAQLMGGDLTFDSPGVGQGTTMCFSIKTKAVPGIALQVRSPKHKVIGLDGNQPTYRILIVDDKIDNRRLLTKLLGPVGFALQEATNGQEAVEIAATWHPHLIWMDMRMPVMDGYEAAKRIKQLSVDSSSPTQDASAADPHIAPIIIAISASSFKTDKDTALVAGCDDFVQKPLRASRIFEAIAQHLNVRYRYAKSDAITGQVQHPTTTERNIIDSNRLLALPDDLLLELKEATLRLQWTRIHQIIQRIEPQDPTLAKTLAHTVEHFRYADILQAAQPQPATVQELAS